ncbi:uncharacterized protein JCM15063_002644 [Sporobolomyces koalae]|uniref:uncharacterized protein n=1 Tax=Sporobolomyces koalae TaxID=500713 RepID=UPI003179A201
MPSVAAADVPVWHRPAPTQEKLDYADLAVVDLSKWPEKKHELVQDLRVAVCQVGFWVVENTGITDDEVVRQISIGNAYLDLPLEEKRPHACDFKNGNFFGFREGFRLMGDTTIKDNSEAICLPKITSCHADDFPPSAFLEPFKPEIEAFQRKVHQRVLIPLLKLFALLLELPEDYFSAPHEWDRPSEDHLRIMRYIPNPAEVDDLLPDKQYLNGHTDFGLVTLLFAQVVQGLQLRTQDGSWKHVRYIPDTIVVNTADILSFASGGYLKSTIHRVIRPPEDQAHVPRVGLFYFSRAAWDYPANKIAPSPVLERLGIYKPDVTSTDDVISGFEFTRARVKHSWDRPRYGDSEFRTGFKHKGLQVRTDYE